jgi:subtilisin family serine protease
VEWWPQREDFPRAWDVTPGNGVVVALIDTGVDASHPELQGKISGTADFDATVGHGPATSDETGHGTHVGSIACASSNNGLGLAGAGLNCGLLVEKSDLSDASVSLSIVDATNRGADAINMSFGTDGSQPASQAEVDAINYAYAHRVVLAAAAADQPTQQQGDPANVLQPTGSGPDINQGKGLTVTAADFGDHRASFAGEGTQISISAYGSFADQGGPRGIFGAFPGNVTTLETGSPGPPFQPPCTNCRTTFAGDSRYAYLKGTSMATPMVTALAALVRHLNPDLSLPEILRVIKQTARRAPGASWAPDLGWGIIDAGAAIDAARRIDHRPPVSHLIAPRVTRSRRVHLHWSATDPAPPGLIPSGIDRYEVWRSTNGHPPVLIAVTRATSMVVRVRPRARYGFFTIAIDRASNREAPPSRPYATTRVLARRARRR